MNLYEFRYWLEGYREGWENKKCPTREQWKRILDKLYYKDTDKQSNESWDPKSAEPTIKWDESLEIGYGETKNVGIVTWSVLPPDEICDTSKPVTYYNQKQNGSK